MAGRRSEGSCNSGSLRRGTLRLVAEARPHGKLQVLLVQAREAQAAAAASAAAQLSLFTDLANWAAGENRGLADVAAATLELTTLHYEAHLALSDALRTLRKELSLVLEGERRADEAQKRLQNAEGKRLRSRRSLLKAQKKVQERPQTAVGGQTPEFNTLQTQLAEAERGAERAHQEACDVSREQEEVKLLILKGALKKFSEAQLNLAMKSKVIFEAGRNVASEIPDPPPPSDQLASIRYLGFERTKEEVERAKRELTGQIQAPLSPTAPNEPPPPYNTSFCRSSSCCLGSPGPSSPGIGTAFLSRHSSAVSPSRY